MSHLLLQAFEGNNTRIPAWIMRQAGRYLPSYRALREKHSLLEMFQNPEIATEVTLMPVDQIGVDAAIMFADILTLPAAMGFDVDYVDGKGPVIANPIKGEADVEIMHDFEDLAYVEKIITSVKQELNGKVPLIGFAGAPFTVLSYLLDGKRSTSWLTLLRMAYTNPDGYHLFMNMLTENTIRYLNLQKEAGIDAFQLFDTWAGQLRVEDYEKYILPYVVRIFTEVDLPSIYYVKNCSHLIIAMEKTGCDFLSVCETVNIGHHDILCTTEKGVQGNLFHGLLYAPRHVIKQEVYRLLDAAKSYHERYIFNLSHGILPDTDPDQLKYVIDLVHQYSWRS